MNHVVKVSVPTLGLKDLLFFSHLIHTFLGKSKDKTDDLGRGSMVGKGARVVVKSSKFLFKIC